MNPLGASAAAISGTLLFTLAYFQPPFFLFYLLSIGTWGLVTWNHWVAARGFDPNLDVDTFIPVTLTSMLTLWHLHTYASPLVTLWSTLLLILPAMSTYLLSTMTPHVHVYSDFRALCILLAASVTLLTVSELT